MIAPGLAAAAVLTLLVGCGATTTPTVTVSVAGRSAQLSPTQLCADDAAQFYDRATQQVLRVAPAQRITIEVSADLAESGWQVQIFDRDLQTQLGQVDAGHATTFTDLTTSDPFPAAYFFVVVQDANSDCDGLSGAWPIGFVRDEDPATTGSSSASPTPAS